MTSYGVHAPQSRLPCGNFIPKLGCHLFFPWASRTSFSRQMASDAVPGLTNESVRWSPHPHQQGPPSNEACFPSSVSCLIASSNQINIFDGLVGFEGSGKSLSVLKTTAPETYTGRKISPSYQLRSVFGLLKAGYTCYFHTYFLRGSNPSTATNCGTTYSNKIHWISMVLQTPPAAATRPWLPHRQLGCIVVEAKLLWGFCWHAKNIGQDLEDSGKQSVKRMTRGKNINQRIPSKGHSGNYWDHEWSIWQSCSRILQALREKTAPKRDPKCEPHLGGHVKSKQFGGPKKRILDLILSLSSLLRLLSELADAFTYLLDCCVWHWRGVFLAESVFGMFFLTVLGTCEGFFRQKAWQWAFLQSFYNRLIACLCSSCHG